jgi:hypothetical protein
LVIVAIDVVKRDVGCGNSLAAIKIATSNVASAMGAAFVACNGQGGGTVSENGDSELAIGITVENLHV